MRLTKAERLYKKLLKYQFEKNQTETQKCFVDNLTLGMCCCKVDENGIKHIPIKKLLDKGKER